MLQQPDLNRTLTYITGSIGYTQLAVGLADGSARRIVFPFGQFCNIMFVACCALRCVAEYLSLLHIQCYMLLRVARLSLSWLTLKHV